MFTFDSVTHRYLHGTRQVRSVTGMIKAAGLLGPAAQFYSKEAAERGTRVHRACLDFDLGLVPDIQHEEAMYLNSYAQWSGLCRPIWTEMEQPKHSERFNFAGTADRVGHIGSWGMDNKPVIVDLKTGGASSWHGIQLALYDVLYDEIPPMIRRRLVLHLKKNGGIPQVVEYHDLSDYTTAYMILAGEHNDIGHNDFEPQTES